MGSYAHLLTGSLVVLSTKNGVDPFVVSLFRESDKQKIEADQDYEDPRKRTGGDLLLSFSRDYYPGDEEYEDEGALHPPYWCYFIYAREARDRLELMGFTRSKAIGVYEESIAEYRKRIEGRYQYLVLPQEKYEREMSVLKMQLSRNGQNRLRRLSLGHPTSLWTLGLTNFLPGSGRSGKIPIFDSSCEELLSAAMMKLQSYRTSHV